MSRIYSIVRPLSLKTAYNQITDMRRSIHPIIAYLFLFTAISTVLYWILVALGLFGVSGLSDWLNRFPYVSPVADTWMGAACLLFFVLWRKNSERCIAWGLAGSSAMIFVSLTAFTFMAYHRAGSFDIPEFIEVVVPLYLLIFGAISFRSLANSKAN